MGLRVGDVVESLFVGTQQARDLSALNGLAPGVPAVFTVNRPAGRTSLVTTRRDAPALTVFAGRDREWVVWTPSGVYETSPLGDRRYLGWHRNASDPMRPTDHFAFDRYERELRRPAAIARLLQTADPTAVAAAAPLPAPAASGPAVVASGRLPDLDVETPGRRSFETLTLGGVDLPLRVRAAKQADDGEAGAGLIRTIRVLVDSARAEEIPVVPPVATVDRPVSVALSPGPHRVSVVAVNDRGKERVSTLDVVAREAQKPAAAALEPRLLVVSLSAGRFGGDEAALPAIPFADEDSRDVSRFLAAPGGTSRFRNVETLAFSTADSTSARIAAAIEDLERRRKAGALVEGDTVFVWVESHMLALPDGPGLLGSDAASDGPSAAVVPAERLAEALGSLAEYGCRVVVFVDVLHEHRPASVNAARALNEWVRGLYARRVVAFVASIHGPSRRYLTHGVFAESIVSSLTVRSRGRLTPGAPAASSISLDEFQDRVAQQALALTGRKQLARCYVPEALSSSIPLFEPPTRRQLRSVKAER
jgi:hypothetical protein